MARLHLVRWSVVGLVSLVCATPARAELMMFRFDGALTGVPAELAGDFALGEDASFTLGFETGGPAVVSPGVYTYLEAPWQGFAGQLGDYAFTGGGGGRFWGYPQENLIAGELHHFSPGLIQGAPVGPSGQYAPLAAFIRLYFEPESLTTEVLASTLPLPIAASMDFYFAYQPDPVAMPLYWETGPHLSVTTTGISAIPEPSTLAIGWLAIGMAAAVFRRQVLPGAERTMRSLRPPTPRM